MRNKSRQNRIGITKKVFLAYAFRDRREWKEEESSCDDNHGLDDFFNIARERLKEMLDFYEGYEYYYVK